MTTITTLPDPDTPIPYWPAYYTATAAATASPPESIPYWPVLDEATGRYADAEHAADLIMPDGPDPEWRRELQAEAG